MDRRNFIRLTATVAAGTPVFYRCSGGRVINGQIVGASAVVGHLLRDRQSFGAPTSEAYLDVAIVGGGVSGLAAARQLAKNGVQNFRLFDLEAQVGGNAASGRNSVSGFAWGAHYVPTPNNNLPEYLAFLKECGVIDHLDADGLPQYNDLHLCFDPQDRLYINGRWQDGLVPRHGVPHAELQQIEAFLGQMNVYRHARGNDGKEAFAIPVNRSTTDPAYTGLDRITMKTWMAQQGYDSAYLHWYVNYCTRDDFGINYDRVSAWAGIHYFASRKGKGSNAAPHDVLTWPEGNGWLVQQLEKTVQSNIRTGALVVRVAAGNDAVLIDYLDIGTNQLHRVVARQCILAVPQFVAARLLEDEARASLVRQHLHYAPWLVANLTVGKLEERSGAPRCWDNVIHGSNSLGYIVANHQQLQQHQAMQNLTYYLPFTNEEATVARRSAHQQRYEAWVRTIFDDLVKVHPNIEAATERIDIMLWGHAMAQPVPGLIHGDIRRRLKEPVGGRIHFAHTDLAGISIFEEAFYQGIDAASMVIQHLTADS